MTLSVSRTHLAIGGLIVLALLAGCYTMNIETEVTSDGQIDQVQVEMVFDDPFVFSALQDEASNQGFETVGEWIANQSDEQEGDWDTFQVETIQEDQTVVMTATGGDPASLEDINVTVDEQAGEITYVDTSGLNQSQGFEGNQSGDGQFDFSNVTYNYVVDMPGEVIDTNGNIIGDGSVVEWTSDMNEEFDQLEVTSAQTGAADDGGDDGGSDDGSSDDGSSDDGSSDDGTSGDGGADDGGGDGGADDGGGDGGSGDDGTSGDGGADDGGGDGGSGDDGSGDGGGDGSGDGGGDGSGDGGGDGSGDGGGDGNASDGDGGDDGGIADGLGPGFGVGAALAGVLIVSGALAVARQRE